MSEIVFEAAVEDVDAVFFEGDDLGCDVVDEVAVMGGEEDGSFEIFESPGKSGDGFEVEVVVGLVEDEDVVVAEHHAAENESGRLSAGEGGEGFEGVIAAEEHFAEDAADILVIDTSAFWLLASQRRSWSYFCRGLRVVLGEVADLRLDGRVRSCRYRA